MTPVTAAKVKYGVWGLIGGAIIAMIIGFAWGGWTTSGTTTKDGRRGGLGGAGGDLRRPIYEATEPSRDNCKNSRKSIPTSARTFIEKGGWDKMPGEEQAGSTVARACVDGLEVLLKK